MLNVGLQHFLLLSGVLFSVGLFGALSKRNVIAVLMSIEIMFNSVNIAFIAFSRFITPTLLTGQVFAVFVITVAAAEAALGLAIAIAFYRARDTVDATQANLMKG